MINCPTVPTTEGVGSWEAGLSAPKQKNIKKVGHLNSTWQRHFLNDKKARLLLAESKVRK